MPDVERLSYVGRYMTGAMCELGRVDIEISFRSEKAREKD